EQPASHPPPPRRSPPPGRDLLPPPEGGMRYAQRAGMPADRRVRTLAGAQIAPFGRFGRSRARGRLAEHSGGSMRVGASYRVSPVSWPDFAAADQAGLVRIINRELRQIQYRPT